MATYGDVDILVGLAHLLHRHHVLLLRILHRKTEHRSGEDQCHEPNHRSRQLQDPANERER